MKKVNQQENKNHTIIPKAVIVVKNHHFSRKWMYFLHFEIFFMLRVT